MSAPRMRLSSTFTLLGMLLGASTRADDPTVDVDRLPPAARRQVDFARDIRPILSKNCNRCHGAQRQKGGLSLHLRSRALAGGDDGPAIVVGKSAESLLIHRVSGLDEDAIMPPDGAGEPLTPEQVGLLRAWIDQGATWPDDGADSGAVANPHWAFRSPVRSELPPVEEQAWTRNPVDYFIAARLEKERLHPSPEASRAVLIRRLYLDLLGLPPSLAEVDAFES